MDITIYALLLGTSFLFLTLYLFTPPKVGLTLAVLAGLMFILVGGVQLVEGVQYQTGYTEHLNNTPSPGDNTTTTVNYDYTNLSGISGEWLGLIWVLTGIGVWIMGLFDDRAMNDLKFRYTE